MRDWIWYLSTIAIIFIFIAVLLSAVEGYSTYGSPSEFGNESDTTCWLGGDTGLLDCTGSGKFGGNLNVTGNITGAGGSFVLKAGDTMTGNLLFEGNKTVTGIFVQQVGAQA